MKILDLSIKPGPPLHFQKPLPVKENTVTEKKTLLLEIHLEKDQQTVSLTAEISLLENYSLYNQRDIIESFNKIKDQLDKIDLASAVDLATTLKMPTPLIHALEVIKFKSLNLSEHQPIKARALNDYKSNAFKLKISKKNLSEIFENLKEHSSNGNQIQVTLDANQQLDQEDWNEFFEAYKTWNNSKNIQLIVEEPLTFEELAKDNFYQKFDEQNIQIAVDEGLPQWYFQGLNEKEIYKRLSLYGNIVFKPGMLTLSQVEDIMKNSDHITPQNVFLSCLYDGPWNLAYFFYISSKLNLSQPAGLYPLMNIEENATYLQLNESKEIISLLK